MKKHTSGPWRIQVAKILPGCNATAYEVVTDEYDVVSPAQGIRKEADAKLIAAAPDLLEALQWLVKELSDSDDEGLIEHVEPMIAARTAIAKALGEEE